MSEDGTSQLLIRNVPQETKTALKIRAAQHGRTQNQEALKILEDALRDDREPWIHRLYRESQDIGGIDLELPERELARDFRIEE